MGMVCYRPSESSWIGLQNDGSGWLWDDGSEFNFLSWADTEPDYPTAATETCGIITDYAMEDRAPTELHGFVCQKDNDG